MKDWKKKFWGFAWMAGVVVWGMGIVFWILSFSIPPTDKAHTEPLGPWWGLVLWIVLPMFWMLCSGFGLNDCYERELGWRKENYGPNNEYIRIVDTTPGKRIVMQWFAPFVLIYFKLTHRPYSSA